MSDEISPRARRLRESGYKLTNARLTVLHVIEQSGTHMTSSEILKSVSAVDSNIGRASVFRTLDLFTHLGIIRPTYVDSSMTPAYVLLPDGHHHHIICTYCNRIIEFDECGLERLEAELEQRYNVRLSGHLLEFFGVCADCRSRPPDDED